MDKQLIQLIKKEISKRQKSLKKVAVGWPIIDEKETFAVLKALLNKEISGGPTVINFERNFAKYVGVKAAVACNSGSSANLLALRTLLETGDLLPGDGVIVPASTFITVAAPLVQLGLRPIFVDIELGSFNIDPGEVEKAAKLAKAVIVVHSLGNPANIVEIVKIAKKFKLKVIEDCCEAHGAEVDGKKVGSFGDLATFSFYVAHNITTGEGGMVLTDNKKYVEILRSLREFGRGRQDKRFGKFGNLGDYDSRYVFERLGYNLRMTSLQAAIGLEQLKKLDKLNKARRANANFYSAELNKYPEVFQTPSENDYHTYYTYQIVLKKDLPFTRAELVNYLEKNNIETRPFFAGSIPDQPAFEKLDFVSFGKLENTRILRDRAFFIGCHPAIDKRQTQKVVDTIAKFLSKFKELTFSYKPKISCIVISFNKPKLLLEALESVFAQTYQNFEVILVDGGSSVAGMKAILTKYSKHPKVKLVYTGETAIDRVHKAMLSVAANIGLEYANGDYITYLCDDDIFLPNRFAQMVNYLKKNKKARIVYSFQKVYNLDKLGNRTNAHVRRLNGLRGKAAVPYLPLDNFIDVNSFMHGRDCLKVLQKPYWPEEKTTQGHNDGIFAERLGEKFVFYPIEEVLDEHRHTGQSLNYKSVSRLRLLTRVIVGKTLGKKNKLQIEIVDN